jgi:hypothetical protein
VVEVHEADPHRPMDVHACLLQDLPLGGLFGRLPCFPSAARENVPTIRIREPSGPHHPATRPRVRLR